MVLQYNFPELIFALYRRGRLRHGTWQCDNCSSIQLTESACELTLSIP